MCYNIGFYKYDPMWVTSVSLGVWKKKNITFLSTLASKQRPRIKPGETAEKNISM